MPVEPKFVTSDKTEGLWVRILSSTQAISFPEYAKFIDSKAFDLAHSGSTAYQSLKDATRRFLKDECERDTPHTHWPRVLEEAEARLSRRFDGSRALSLSSLDRSTERMALPGDLPRTPTDHRQRCLVELIWSYWHEEAMLVKTLKAICERFQNQLAPEAQGPLQGLDFDSLRPLSNLLWGYIRDEPDRISVRRRAHEYEHQYGFSLLGIAGGSARLADRRSKVHDSFHNLLVNCVSFYAKSDDKTVVADGFGGVLNALKETHLALTEGAHDQRGDLPVIARAEMLTEMWLLSRPEMREFLGGRPSTEAWMDRVDHMKSLQCWTDVSAVHFRDLAVFGEQLLLSIRFSQWSRPSDPSAAGAWARFWRQEVQGYIQAYRATTGVDLSATD